MMEITDLTVVVPTRNESRNIGPFLASLPPSIPLVVVDASSDATPTLVARQRARNTLLIRHPGSIPVARQLGAEAARTAWLLFTDADVTFAPDYFTRLRRPRPPADALYGPKLSRDRYRRYYRWFSRGQQLSQAFGIPAVSGSNLLVRAGALEACGGFDPQLTVNEDSELGFRLQRHGFRLRFAPELVVYARDHRRLERGVWRKTGHSLLRCALLYTNLLPERWRRKDWGYWSNAQEKEEQRHGAT
jgi:glycosyltransferase involved in cell wall biosynthesis